jgi:hypothetical protein
MLLLGSGNVVIAFGIRGTGGIIKESIGFIQK